MARQKENTRKSRKVIYIVCEGIHTEPLFFASIRDRVIEGKYNIGDCEINIVPQPIEPEETPAKNFIKKRGSYIADKKRTALKKEEKKKEIVDGAPPLNWVLTAQEKLRGSESDEAWAVFDKDGHPAMKEAFERANDDIDGKRVNIAFSSRSFEYYLLLHFEYIFQEFNATECGIRNERGNKKSLDCMCKNPKPGACNGDKCINGYARMKGYWEKTKENQSTFALVEDKLNAGIVHARRLRFISEQIDKRIIYERNPYVTVDKLVCRLTNTHVIESGVGCEVKYGGVHLSINIQNSYSLIVKHIFGGTVILPNDFFQIYNAVTNSLTPLEIRKILYPGSEEEYFCYLTHSKALVVNTQYVEGNYIFLRNYQLDLMD